LLIAPAGGVGAAVTEPGSSTTPPGASAEGNAYGNRPGTETGVSGSFASRRSSQIDRPFAAPKSRWSAPRSSDRRGSSPPFAPNRAAISAAAATTSFAVNGATGVPAFR